jgi:cytochrome o ubiquinol oxidase subunit 3
MSSHAATAIDHHHDPSTSTGIPNKKLLMWTFLASDCMFFGALISTHLIYRLHPPAGGLDPKVVFSPELTSFSTFILLMSPRSRRATSRAAAGPCSRPSSSG